MADSPLLLKPISIGPVHVPNRMFLPPMCQYSVAAQDGVPTDWHLAHSLSRAAGGFGMIVTEATSVTPEGRISPQDLGLWNDTQAAAFPRITQAITDHGSVPVIQLAHAGAKASTWPMWPNMPVGSVPIDDGGWQTLSPSGINPVSGLAQTRAMSVQDIQNTVQAFADAAQRADQAGYQGVQIHGAHGYLIHQFLSGVTNKREDQYGGSFENRTRFVKEIIAAVRAVWPKNKLLGLRLSADDYVEGSWSIDDSSRLLQDLEAEPEKYGLDWVDASSGGIGDTYQGPTGPSYQVPLAERLKHDTHLVVSAVGVITEAEQAEEILQSGKADAVCIGRSGLAQPNWPVFAAYELGVDRRELPFAPQYFRGNWRSR